MPTGVPGIKAGGVASLGSESLRLLPRCACVEVDEQVVARSALIIADLPHEVASDTGDMLAEIGRASCRERV